MIKGFKAQMPSILSDANSSTSAARLLATVVNNGFCIGCGACAAVTDSPFSIVMNNNGQYEASLNLAPELNLKETDIEAVCPFSEQSVTEDDIARGLYRDTCRWNKNAGYYLSAFTGYVNEGNFRVKGSSGGYGTWIISELLINDLVDYVIHVQPALRSAHETLFSYGISDNESGIRAGSKSRYYPIEMSSVLRMVREQPGRYALVGLPCFIKSVRLLQRSDRIFAERIKYCIGLVCGHLKSARYAESLAWQMGVMPDELTAIDFRVKDDDAPADRYNTTVSDNTRTHTRPAKDLFGTDWGMGAFKYKACDYCDDVFAETADVVLGDAWLPKFAGDSKGTNILVVRKQEIATLLDNAQITGRITLDKCPIDLINASQRGGLRHRKDAISYRLHLEKNKGRWVPRKRVTNLISIFPDFERRRQIFRAKLREMSHSSFEIARRSSDLTIYLEQMQPIYKEYLTIHGNLLDRLKGLLRRKLRRVP